ncbi:MAG: MBL fold metallo-hydrolase [Candidatus Lokiarchaeota archaeon]|nr:MBL fold metallo-hydrolase [Candidatus Lokiarchaeota archaeon]
MVNIKYLGSCREVGRSAILIESKNGDQCMLDYGVRFNEEDRLPFESNLSKLKAVALTHCHIDHSGAIPFLYKKKKNLPLLTNSVTIDIIDKLINDMLRISKYAYPFGYHELNQMVNNAYFLNNGVRHKIAHNFYLTFYDAGHVPGSVSILVDVDGKKILYSGDMNSNNTNLVNSADSSQIPEIHAAIIESTYSLRKHPPRDELEKEFVEEVINITENGGNVLVPAFGVARSQEAVMILDKYQFKGNIYLDGMAKLITKIYLNHPNTLKNKNYFRNALKKAKFVEGFKKKKDYLKNNSVIVSPSGMLKGGSVLKYIKPILNDHQSAIFMVGYQVEGTPGRNLLENKVFEFKESNKQRNTNYDLNIKAKCRIKHFDFSSHSDGKGLHSYVDNLKFVNNGKQVFCVHGDPQSTTTLAKELVNKKYNSVAPELGEVYSV